MLRIVIVGIDAVGGAEGIRTIPVKTAGWHLALALGATLFVAWRLRGSRMGYAFEAIREDERGADDGDQHHLLQADGVRAQRGGGGAGGG